jgi:hypothetical protein
VRDEENGKSRKRDSSSTQTGLLSNGASFIHTPTSVKKNVRVYTGEIGVCI